MWIHSPQERPLLNPLIFSHIPYKTESLTFLPSFRGGMEKAMAPHSSTLAWKIPWTEEPGRLQSIESRRVRHD